MYVFFPLNKKFYCETILKQIPEMSFHAYVLQVIKTMAIGDHCNSANL